MIRRLALIALGAAIWAGAYLTPDHVGGWGVVRGLAIVAGSMTAGLNTGHVLGELRDRAGMRWRWWRNRRNTRRGRGWSSWNWP